MPIAVHCTSCRKQFKTARENQGKRTKCPDCGALFRIPQIPVEPAASAETPPPAASVPPTETTTAQGEVASGLASKAARTVQAVLTRCWLETRLTAAALWDAIRRIASFATRYYEELRASHTHRQALIVLGEEMARQRIGDPAVLSRLGEIELALAMNEEKKGSARGLKAERRRLCLQLGQSGEANPTTMAKLEKESQQVAALRKALDASRTARQDARDAISPPAGSRRRVAMGVLAIGMCLFLYGRWSGGTGNGTVGRDAVVDEPIALGGNVDLTTSPYADVVSGKVTTGPIWDEWSAAYELCNGTKPTGPIDTAVGTASFGLGVGLSALGFTGDIGLDKHGRVGAIHLTGSGNIDDRLGLLRRLPHLTQLDLSDADFDRITDRGLQSLGSLTNLEWLKLAGLKISEEAVSYLRGLQHLRHLDLRGTRLTDRGMSSLAGLTSLEFLDVSKTKITDAGVPHLSGLVNLQTLLLYHGNDINPRHVYQHLARLKKLTNFSMIIPYSPAMGETYLDLLDHNMTKVQELPPLEKWKLHYEQNHRTDYTMKKPLVSNWNELRVLSGEMKKVASDQVHYDNYQKEERKSIAAWVARAADARIAEIMVPGSDILPVIEGMDFKELPLAYCPCSDAELSRIAKFAHLEVLDLTGSSLTAKGLAYLASLEELRYLNLTGTGLRKQDLMALKTVPRLTDVVISDCPLTSDDIKELDTLLPRVRFVNERNEEYYREDGTEQMDTPARRLLKLYLDEK